MKRDRILFSSIAIMELVHAAVASLQHRVPTGHDGFQFFTLQYFFLNNAINTREIAQWIPYMNQGTIATLWYGIQGSLLQSVLLFSGSLLRHADLLSVYHAGMFVDAMILLIGTWSLARRFFRTPAVFFIAVSVVGSSVWLDQPYWNFRLYYALPLVIELGHRFLATHRWRWFFLSANLLAVQTMGNLPYLLPVSSFTVCAYFLLFAATDWQTVRASLSGLKWGLPAVLSVAFSAASFVAVYSAITMGTGQLLSYNPGRLRDGTTSLAGFLTYGGSTDARKWLDLVLNLSPWLDFTVYAGVLVAPLVICGALLTDRRRVHFVLLALTLLMFTLGTFVSVALFYAWPGMKYFRHIALVTPLVRVLFCFVAGIGFEPLFDPQVDTGRTLRLWAAAASAVLLLFVAGLAISLARSGPALGDFVNTLSTPLMDRPIHTYSHDRLVFRLRSAAALAVAGAAVIAMVPALLAIGGFARTSRWQRALQYGVLALVAADVYHFKLAFLVDRSDSVREDLRFVLRPTPMVYPRRRAVDLQQAVLAFDNPRLQATLAFSPMLRLRLLGQIARGAEYWTNDAFVFADEAGSSFRVDSWLRPLDQLMRMNWKVPIDETSELPKGVEMDRLRFPFDHPAAAGVAGVERDKIRFFADAYSVEVPGDLVPLMTDQSYRGNLLFVLPSASEMSGTIPIPWRAQLPLGSDDSRPIAYEVQQFDANNVVVLVTNPGPRAIWMSYADVWHPLWRASVNGQPASVYRAQMAYKAVPLALGKNVVHLQFGSPLFSAVAALLAANALFWLCAVAGMISGLLRAPASATMRTVSER